MHSILCRCWDLGNIFHNLLTCWYPIVFCSVDHEARRTLMRHLRLWTPNESEKIFKIVHFNAHQQGRWLIIDHVLSTREGNVFTRVCYSVYRGKGQTPPSPARRYRTRPAPPPPLQPGRYKNSPTPSPPLPTLFSPWPGGRKDHRKD